MSNSDNSRPEFRGIAPYIEVFDMPVSLKFYRDVLGFSIIGSSGEGDDIDWVLLQLNDAQFMLNTAYEKLERPEFPDPSRNKGHQDVTFYFSCKDIDGLYKYLTGKKVNVIKKPHMTGYGWKAIKVKDPDGYGLCFHWSQEQ